MSFGYGRLSSIHQLYTAPNHPNCLSLFSHSGNRNVFAAAPFLCLPWRQIGASLPIILVCVPLLWIRCMLPVFFWHLFLECIDMKSMLFSFLSGLRFILSYNDLCQEYSISLQSIFCCFFCAWFLAHWCSSRDFSFHVHLFFAVYGSDDEVCPASVPPAFSWKCTNSNVWCIVFPSHLTP